jgi:hypothetical protein
MYTGPNHFFITLVSTASRKQFPSITHTAFTTELAKTIDLNSDKWKVGFVNSHILLRL